MSHLPQKRALIVGTLKIMLARQKYSIVINALLKSTEILMEQEIYS